MRDLVLPISILLHTDEICEENIPEIIKFKYSISLRISYHTRATVLLYKEH